MWFYVLSEHLLWLWSSPSHQKFRNPEGYSKVVGWVDWGIWMVLHMEKRFFSCPEFHTSFVIVKNWVWIIIYALIIHHTWRRSMLFLFVWIIKYSPFFNRLTPNDHYRGCTTPLTSKRCILYIYSTNIGTEYFKHGIYSLFFLFKMQFVS